MIVLILGLCVKFGYTQEIPMAKLPAMITACGQSPDTLLVRILCDRNKIKVYYEPAAKSKDLEDIKTLLIVLGGSAKGLGQAGIDEKGELERVEGILAKCKEKKIQIIGIHVGGEARRGPLSAKFIDLAAPKADFLIVTEDGNKDNYFTKLSKEKKIPLTIIQEINELGNLLKRIFQTK